VYDHGTTIVRGLTLVEALDTRRNEVWRAVATGDGAKPADGGVAVKLLHPAYEPVIPRRFGRRARALTRIVERGTNWVPVLDHGYTTDGRRYVVSPLHRSSLADQLDHGPTPWYLAARLIANAAETVAEAHARGYSFGYLRPSGILIDRPADARIVAFGTSTRRFDDGTAQFMAPELADDTNPIPPSDVFSLVLILASLLGGRPIDHREPPRDVIDELTGTAPQRILEIIDYGLSANILNRFADAGKLAGALDATLRRRSSSGRRRRNAPSDEAIDPLSAIMAEPLVTVDDDGTAGGTAVGANGLSIPDRRDARHPDETPTAVPFDVPMIGIDDPTDPGIAAHRELDDETEHFGTLAHLVNLPTNGNQPSSEPLADFLTALDRGSKGPSGGNDRSRNDANRRPPHPPATVVPRPPMGSIIEIPDHQHGQTDLALSREPGSMTETWPMKQPSLAFAIAGKVGRFVAVRRRRIITTVAIISVIGAAVLIGAGNWFRDDVTGTGRTPVSSSIVSEQVTVEQPSPLSDP